MEATPTTPTSSRVLYLMLALSVRSAVAAGYTVYVRRVVSCWSTLLGPNYFQVPLEEFISLVSIYLISCVTDTVELITFPVQYISLCHASLCRPGQREFYDISSSVSPSFPPSLPPSLPPSCLQQQVAAHLSLFLKVDSKK